MASPLLRILAWACGCSLLAPNPADAATSGVTMREGGIVRGPQDRRELTLVFTGHTFAEGGAVILDALARHRARAGFFLTGDFLANADFSPLVRRIVAEGHYLGPHSDRHLLYCPWSGPKRTLIAKETFAADLTANLEKIVRLGVPRDRIRYFLPPYEWHNAEIAAWSTEQGLTIVNYTPGTRANADYTGEAERNFVSSQTIFTSIEQRERADPQGLNGFILLLHLGSGPGRTDKFHSRFGELLDLLAARGYRFVRVDEMLDAARPNSPRENHR
ncbi:MAG: polysaccharide deacetylase family protein [Opitutae bacterium]|nr:polysaccharide deacetylase family protein [Opitutae bacterium]